MTADRFAVLARVAARLNTPSYGDTSQQVLLDRADVAQLVALAEMCAEPVCE